MKKMTLSSVFAAAMLCRDRFPSLCSRLSASIVAEAENSCGGLLAKIRRNLQGSHLIEFETDETALAAAAIFAEKGSATAFVLADPRRQYRIGFLRGTRGSPYGSWNMSYRDLEPDWSDDPAMFLRSVSLLTAREEKELGELTRGQLTGRVKFAESGDVEIAIRNSHLARRAERLRKESRRPMLYRAGTNAGSAYVSRIGPASLSADDDEARIRIGREQLLEVAAVCTAGDLLTLRCDGSDERSRVSGNSETEKPFSVSFRFPSLTPEAGEQPVWAPMSDLVYTAGAREEPMIGIPADLAAEAAGRFWWLSDGEPIGLSAALNR